MRTSFVIASIVSMLLGAACGGSGPDRQSLPDPSNPYYSALSAIWAFSPQDVWAVGGRVLHYDGSRWSEVAGPGTGIALQALWGLAPDDLWATSGSKIYRWRGAAKGWSEHPHGITSPPDFNALWVRAEDDYAVGGGDVNWEVVRVKGSTISRAYTYGQTTGIWGASSDDVWAAAEMGGLWRWNGSKWAKVELGGNADRPGSVWGSSASDVWAVGEQETLQHWDGSAWTQTELADADLTVVWASASDVWAAGHQGSVWHFDGKSWSDQGSAGAGVFFTGLSGAGGSVWAVGYELSTSGNHGVVFRLR